MTFAIIAAGEGSRLKADGVAASKPLVPVLGVPLIERLIETAADAGAGQICCVIRPDAADLKAFLLSHPFSVHPLVIARSTPSSMHSLFALAPYLRNGPFCLATTDAVFRPDEFRRFFRYATRKSDSDGVLAVAPLAADERPLAVTLDGHRRITRFSDSPAGCRWATGGIYYLSPRIFSLMEAALQSNTQQLRNYFRLLLARGFRFHGYPFSRIVDVDRLRDLRAAEELLQGEEHGIERWR